MFFIAYIFKGQVYVFVGQVKIVSHSSCRKSTILKYFCPLIDLLVFATVATGLNLKYNRNMIDIYQAHLPMQSTSSSANSFARIIIVVVATDQALRLLTLYSCSTQLSMKSQLLTLKCRK